MIGPSQEDIARKTAENVLDLVAKMDRGDIEDAIAASPPYLFGDLAIAITARDRLEIGEQVLKILTNYLLESAESKARDWARSQEDAERFDDNMRARR